ncbi:MAG: FG-GAP repeat protein [bacterium]
MVRPLLTPNFSQKEESDEGFGISVCISGNRAIVGAYLDDDAGSASGSDRPTWPKQFKGRYFWNLIAVV